MYIDVNGIKLYYKKRGNGKPLIMVHCHRKDHKIFNEAVKVLEKGFTVYTIDSRDHGKSTRVKELHYEDMAKDIYLFIKKLGIEKPIYYGFSDGGIIGIILASRHPDLLSRLIVSGANTSPDGIKNIPLMFYKFLSAIDKRDITQIMTREPNITDDMLEKISVETHVTCGSRDIIKQSHTEHIAEKIPNSSLKIFDGESHGSYIKNQKAIAEYILYLEEKI